MGIFRDASYKGIAKEYAALEKIKNVSRSSGGFFDSSVEKKYKRAIKSWEDCFIRNSNNSVNVMNINKLTYDVKCDITKTKEFNRIFTDHFKFFNDIIKSYKSDKNVTNNSVLRMFNDIYNILTSQKYISAFKIAYEEREKNKGKPYSGSVADMLIMCHQILVSFEFFCMGTINIAVIDSYNQVKNIDPSSKDFSVFLNDIQNTYKSLICDLGYVAINIVANLETIKNPAEEFKKAIKAQKESIDKIAKANESFDIATQQKTYFELSEESYLEDKTGNFDKGTEDGVIVAVIVVSSIIGFFLMIKLIRRAIYMIGTIKTDIGQYVMVDVATITMNIQTLQERLNETTDPKERKRLESIIKKQQIWVAKFKDTADNLIGETTNGAIEAEYVVENEDKTDNTYNNDKKDESQTTSTDDYDILM